MLHSLANTLCNTFVDVFVITISLVFLIGLALLVLVGGFAIFLDLKERLAK